MIINNFFVGTSTDTYVSGICSINSKKTVVDITVYREHNMSVVYKTNSLPNGNYILVGLKPDNYVIVAKDIQGLYSPVLKKINGVIDLPYMNQIDTFNEWNNDLNLDISPENNTSLSLSDKISPLNNDYHGIDTINGFVEGVSVLPIDYKLSLIFENSRFDDTLTNPIYTITGIDKTGIKYIEFDGKREIYDDNIHNNQERGYISASVVITECLDSDFVIQCFRSSDKKFVGEYPIIADRYTIDNLILTQTYDIMLYDKNKVVETQVHSRRTPSIYQ